MNSLRIQPTDAPAIPATANSRFPIIVNGKPITPNFRDASLFSADFSRLFGVIGNGDPHKGFEIFQAMTMRLQEARAKHQRYAVGRYQALGVVGEEYREFERAVLKESEQRQYDEALDVIVTALRFYGKEFLE